jgi:2,3-bisphosphoglycerate-dependent phosphoglycerate mutase
VTRIVLIRHGESACNVAGTVGGHKGCSGLSDVGRSQAETLRDRLMQTGELQDAGALYSSVLPRAVETAQIIAPAVGGGVTGLVEDCCFCELHPGESDGITWDEFEERYGQPEMFANPTKPFSPDGESWNAFVGRITGAVEAVVQRHPGELVVVACHGGVIEATMVSLLPFGEQLRPMRLPTAYTSLTEWEKDDQDWTLVRYNDVAHLGGPDEAQRNGRHRAYRRSERRDDAEADQQE